jgi:transposase
MRQVLNAIFSVVVGGIPWRILPREYPNRCGSRLGDINIRRPAAWTARV